MGQPRRPSEEEKRLRALVAFYDSFLKLVLKGMKDIMGERGALSVLKFAAREYGAGLAESFKALGVKDLQAALMEMLKRAGVEPELGEEGGELVVRLRRCPFRRPQEEPFLCAITEGLLMGFINAFKRAVVLKLATIAEGAESCEFRISG